MSPCCCFLSVVGFRLEVTRRCESDGIGITSVTRDLLLAGSSRKADSSRHNTALVMTILRERDVRICGRMCVMPNL